MTVEITSVLSSENGYFHDGFATSIAATDSRLYVRDNWGLRAYGHGAQPVLGPVWDLQGRPGYEKHGDAFETVMAVGASPDGFRVLAAYKQEHGVLVLNARWSGSPEQGGHHTGPDGQIIGEFQPSNATSCTVVKSGSTYTGFGLQPGRLTYVDITAPSLGVLKPRALPVGRQAQGLITVGERAAFVDAGC